VGVNQESRAPGLRNPSGPRSRPLMIGWSTNVQAWGCVGFSRPNSVKYWPARNWRLAGSEIVSR
jgi:hypothetical protein